VKEDWQAIEIDELTDDEAAAMFGLIARAMCSGVRSLPQRVQARVAALQEAGAIVRAQIDVDPVQLVGYVESADGKMRTNLFMVGMDIPDMSESVH
jgi:hypothetical protein